MKSRKVISIILLFIFTFLGGMGVEFLRNNLRRLIIYRFAPNEKIHDLNLSAIRAAIKRYSKDSHQYPNNFGEIVAFDPAIHLFSISPFEKDGSQISYEILSKPSDPCTFPIIYEKKPYIYQKYHTVVLPCGARVLAKSTELELILGTSANADK